MSRRPKTTLARLAAAPIAEDRPRGPSWDTPAPESSQEVSPPADGAETRRRGRPRSEAEAQTPYLLRLPTSEYRRLSRVAMDEGITLRELLRRGASLYLAQLGLGALER